MRSLEPLKIVFDKGFDDEWTEFETGRSSEPVEGHSSGWASGNKRVKGRSRGMYSGF